MNAQSLNEKDLTRIRSFLAVADEKSFTRAGKALFLTQQAVSRHVQKLERSLGLELVTRTTRTVRLTPGGESFAAAAVAIVEQLDALWASTIRTGVDLSRAIDVGM